MAVPSLALHPAFNRQEATLETANRFARVMGGDYSKVSVAPQIVPAPTTYHLPDGRTIVAGNGTDIATMHEMGHATGSRIIPKKVSGLTRGLALRLRAPGIVGAAALGATDDPNEGMSGTAKALTGGHGVMYAPTLLEEGRASKRALQALYRLEGLRGVGRGALPLATAFGTYATAAAAPYLAYKASKGLRRYQSEEAGSSASPGRGK